MHGDKHKYFTIHSKYLNTFAALYIIYRKSQTRLSRTSRNRPHAGHLSVYFLHDLHSGRNWSVTNVFYYVQCAGFYIQTVRRIYLILRNPIMRQVYGKVRGVNSVTAVCWTLEYSSAISPQYLLWPRFCSAGLAFRGPCGCASLSLAA